MSNAQIASTKVIIIGAGAAGLGAGLQLKTFGFDVTVLEARDRIGGRVFTSSTIDGIDLGASIITGLIGNPLDELYHQLDIRGVEIGERSKLFNSATGEPVSSSVDSRMEKMFNKALDLMSKVKSDKPKTDSSLGTDLDFYFQQQGLIPSEIRCLDWYYSNLEYACACDLSKLSMMHWDQDDEHDFDGPHMMVADGYQSMLKPLADELDIVYNAEVVNIKYHPQIDSDSASEVVIKTSDGREFSGNVALVTLPLGVLKDDWVKFEPALPKEKIESIKRLGFGLLNKIVLKFDKPFWDTNIDWIGSVNDDIKFRSKRGFAYLFWNMRKFTGQPILVALCAGQAAHDIEELPDHILVSEATSILQHIHHLPRRPIPKVSIVTRWKNDKYARGSYSFVEVGSSGQDYDILSQSVDNCLFFAGEATNRFHPATVAGAYESGLREAAKIYNIFNPPDTSFSNSTFKKSDHTNQADEAAKYTKSHPKQNSGTHQKRRGIVTQRTKTPSVSPEKEAMPLTTDSYTASPTLEGNEGVVADPNGASVLAGMSSRTINSRHLSTPFNPPKPSYQTPSYPKHTGEASPSQDKSPYILSPGRTSFLSQLVSPRHDPISTSPFHHTDEWTFLPHEGRSVRINLLVEDRMKYGSTAPILNIWDQVRQSWESNPEPGPVSPPPNSVFDAYFSRVHKRNTTNKQGLPETTESRFKTPQKRASQQKQSIQDQKKFQRMIGKLVVDEIRPYFNTGGFSNHLQFKSLAQTCTEEILRSEYEKGTNDVTPKLKSDIESLVEQNISRLYPDASKQQIVVDSPHS